MIGSPTEPSRRRDLREVLVTGASPSRNTLPHECSTSSCAPIGGKGVPGSTKKLAWFDKDNEIGKAQRAWATGINGLQTTFEGLLAQADTILLATKPHREQPFYKNAYKLCEARTIAGKLVNNNKEVDLKSFIEVIKESKPLPATVQAAVGIECIAAPANAGSSAAVSIDPATPPCGNYLNLRTIQTMLDMGGEYEAQCDMQGIKEVSHRVSTFKAASLQLVGTLKVAIKELNKAKDACSRLAD